MRRYDIDGEVPQQAALGAWVNWSDVEALQEELRGVRTLNDDLGKINDKLRYQLQDVTAKALSAVWLLVQEGVNMTEDLSELHDAVIGMHQDREVADKLREELRRTEEELRRKREPVPVGVNAVYGHKVNDKAELRYALVLTSVRRALNGGLEIEVQLP
jgi:hypothetical protein